MQLPYTGQSFRELRGSCEIAKHLGPGSAWRFAIVRRDDLTSTSDFGTPVVQSSSCPINQPWNLGQFWTSHGVSVRALDITQGTVDKLVCLFKIFKNKIFYDLNTLFWSLFKNPL